MRTGLNKLQARIEYQFIDIQHLKTALTHRSAHKNNNERLEFLGDAVLGGVIARALFEGFPGSAEGKLTRMRAKLVRGDTLSELAERYDVSPAAIRSANKLNNDNIRIGQVLSIPVFTGS